MEDNIIMSTSVMQYLEDIRTYIKESHVVKSNDKLDLLSSEQNEEENKGVQFDIEQAGNSELNPLDIDYQDQLSLFDNKVNNIFLNFHRWVCMKTLMTRKLFLNQSQHQRKTKRILMKQWKQQKQKVKLHWAIQTKKKILILESQH